MQKEKIKTTFIFQIVRLLLTVVLIYNLYFLIKFIFLGIVVSSPQFIFNFSIRLALIVFNILMIWFSRVEKKLHLILITLFAVINIILNFTNVLFWLLLLLSVFPIFHDFVKVKDRET